MHGLMLEMAGIAVGIGAYAAGRGVVALRSSRRSVTRTAHVQRLDGLLAPYDQLTPCPVPVRDGAARELPANVYRLRPR